MESTYRIMHFFESIEESPPKLPSSLFSIIHTRLEERLSGGYERREVSSMYKLLAVLGVMLIAAPFLLGYNTQVSALWVSVVSGILVVGLAGIEWLKKGTWEYAVLMVIGMAMVLTPFALNFANSTVAVWTTISLGVVIAVLSATKYLETKTPYEW